MKPAEREEIIKSIEARIKQLLEDIEILKDHMKPVTLKCVVDKANKMDAISNNAVKDSVYRNSIEKIKILENQVQKVDEPDFGNCRMCNQPINPQRLKFLPESTLCVACANR
ncbi:MAG: TraR/DksA C4-type zinc finger protein [Bacteroidota bacterium]|nr:TraR/DksA C4-type zinc finger protein [Bacteroidota bacterium]